MKSGKTAKDQDCGNYRRKMAPVPDAGFLLQGTPSRALHSISADAPDTVHRLEPIRRQN